MSSDAKFWLAWAAVAVPGFFLVDHFADGMMAVLLAGMVGALGVAAALAASGRGRGDGQSPG